MRDDMKGKLAAGIQLAVIMLYIYFVVKKEAASAGKKCRK